MRRFYFSPEQRKGNKVRLESDESKHISKVLRLGVGADVELLDGRGNIYPAVITETKREVELELGAPKELPADNATEIILLQALLKGDKMDLVVQKVTELGASQLWPIHMSRCQGKLESFEKKAQRFEKIALAACKQCMRPRLMKIATPALFEELVAANFPENCLKLLFWEEEKECTLYDLAGRCAKVPAIALLLGPEGGISEEEVALARNHGWQSVGLGERILRAETASITTLSLIQYVAGNLR